MMTVIGGIMNRYWVTLVLAIAVNSAFAVYKVGDVVDNMCWQDVTEKEVCLEQHKAKVRVLLYNAGWCPPCNEEFSEISPLTGEFDGQAVEFISLSASGWSKTAPPDAKFLKEWKAKHGIPFTVAGSPKDAGKQFIEPPLYIPNVAIIGKDGKLAYAEVNPGVPAILAEVRRLLAQ